MNLVFRLHIPELFWCFKLRTPTLFGNQLWYLVVKLLYLDAIQFLFHFELRVEGLMSNFQTRIILSS